MRRISTAWHYAGAMSELKGGDHRLRARGRELPCAADLVDARPGRRDGRHRRTRAAASRRCAIIRAPAWCRRRRSSGELADEHDFVVVAAPKRRPRAARRARPRCRAGGRRRQAARAERRRGGRARRARAREREAADGVPEPALGLRPPHAAQAAGGGRAGRRPAVRVALRALAPGAARGCMARDRGAGGGRRRPARSRQPPRRSGAAAVRAGEPRLRRDRQPPGVARRRRRVRGAATPLRHLQPPVDVGARRRSRAAPARARNARRLRRRRGRRTGGRAARPAGARTIPARGASSRSRAGAGS